MSKENDETLEKIMRAIEELKSSIKELSEKVERLAEEKKEQIVPLRGSVINLEYTKRQVFEYLKKKNMPLSAKEISEGVRISRSHASAVLNELFREGKVKKLRERREIKFIPAES